MLTTQIIAKTRDRIALSTEEIQHLVRGITDGSIPDYQISAWAMAVLCRGVSPSETAALTECMLNSGDRLTRCSDRPRVDKHSTGGLGDKTSLILAPLLACFDLDVPMLSGRGLGITGGTLDKLESYPGYRCNLTTEEINKQLGEIGCVITGTTASIAPADRKLYGLRDASGTVPSVALITASIMSKKLAETLDALVLDVKWGSGAFMQTLEDAKLLQSSLVSAGQRCGVNTSSLLTDMNQPLGRMVGNACEVNESMEFLEGHCRLLHQYAESGDKKVGNATGPVAFAEGSEEAEGSILPNGAGASRPVLTDPLADLVELTIELCVPLLVATRRAADAKQARRMLAAAVLDGRALNLYQKMIEAQGGKFSKRLPLAASHLVLAKQDGFVSSFDGQNLGHSVVAMGGGRRQQNDPINHQVGLEILRKIGDPVEAQQPLIRFFFDGTNSQVEAIANQIQAAVSVTNSPPPPLSLIVNH